MPYIPEGNIKKMAKHLEEAGLPYTMALALAELFDTYYTAKKPPKNHKNLEGAT